NAQSICVSPDSRFVCMPSLAGNLGSGGFNTFVFAVEDLKRPAFKLATGPSPRLVGFDPAAGLVLAQNNEKQLLVHDSRGAEHGSYTLPEAGNDVRQFAAHPAGQKLLVLTS